MKPEKYFKRIKRLFLSVVLSVCVLVGCVSKESIKTPLSEPPPHPQLARMQSLSLEVAKDATYLGSSKRYQKNGITVVILKGEPYEIGYSRGVLLKNEMKEFVRDWLYVAHKYNFEKLMSRSKQIERFIPTEYKEELMGLSAGTGIDYQALLMLNVLNTIGRDMGCTSIAITGQDGKILRSRNYDYFRNFELFRNLMLIIYHPAQGHPFASLSPPGLIGILTAMNDQGFTFGFHMIAQSSTRFLNGIPILILNRQVTQYAGSIEDAGKILADAPRCEPRMWMVTDSERARIYEFDDQKITFKDMNGGDLILTEHTQVLNIGSPYPSSLTRYNDAKRFFTENRGKMDLKKLVELNRSPSISRAYDQRVKNLHSAIFRPSTLDFWIAIEPPPSTKGNWIGFNLNKELYDQGNEPEPVIIPAEK